MDTLLQVVALDDVVGLVAYSIAISVALASATGAFHAGAIFKPLAINALVLLLGGGFGFFLKLLLHKRSTDNRLIVSIALLFAFCGICAMLDVSPLLGCMSMGMVYINLTDDKRLFQQLNLQLLIVTPLQKIHIIEPFVASVGFVHNEGGRDSRLRCLTIEEYRAQKAGGTAAGTASGAADGMAAAGAAEGDAAP